MSDVYNPPAPVSNGWLVPWYFALSAGLGASSNNAINICDFSLDVDITFTTILVSSSTADAAGLYSWGICDLSGNILANMSSAVHIPVAGNIASGSVGTVTLSKGRYVFFFTGNGTTGKIGASASAFPLSFFSSSTATSTSSSGLATGPLTLPSKVNTQLGKSSYCFGLQ